MIKQACMQLCFTWMYLIMLKLNRGKFTQVL